MPNSLSVVHVLEVHVQKLEGVCFSWLPEEGVLLNRVAPGVNICLSFCRYWLQLDTVSTSRCSLQHRSSSAYKNQAAYRQAKTWGMRLGSVYNGLLLACCIVPNSPCSICIGLVLRNQACTAKLGPPMAMIRSFLPLHMVHVIWIIWCSHLFACVSAGTEVCAAARRNAFHPESLGTLDCQHWPDYWCSSRVWLAILLAIPSNCNNNSLKLDAVSHVLLFKFFHKLCSFSGKENTLQICVSSGLQF